MTLSIQFRQSRRLMCRRTFVQVEEVSSALHQLLLMCNSDAAALRQYLPLIKGLLDHLANMTDAQIRVIFRVFAILCTDPATGVIDNEFQIMLHKGIHSQHAIYQRIAVLGYLALISHVAAGVKTETPEEIVATAAASAAGVAAPSSRARHQRTSITTQSSLGFATETIENIRKTFQAHPHSLAMFYDELSRAISNQQIHVSVVQSIAMYVSCSFLFVCVTYGLLTPVCCTQASGVCLRTICD